ALLGEIACELVDQQPAVGEDQHAGGAGGVHEAGRRDRLARRRRVFEAVAAAGTGIVPGGDLLHLVQGGHVRHGDIKPLGIGDADLAVAIAIAIAVAVAVGVGIAVVLVLVLVLV